MQQTADTNGNPPAPQMSADAYLDAVDEQVRLARILERPVPVTWWLLIFNVAIWGAGLLYGWSRLVDGLGISAEYLRYEQLALYTGMKVNSLMVEGQWWRLFSSQFVHLDLMHMIFNGYGLYVLGPLLERFYGSRRFFVLYLASGTVASLASFWFNAVPAGGASGAIYGLVGGLLVFGWQHRDTLPSRLSRAFTVGLLPWVVLSLAIGFIDFIPMDNAAHLGGFFSGIAIVLAMYSRLRPIDARLRDGFLWLLALVGGIALVWTAAHWSDEVTECTESRQAYFECYPGLMEVAGDVPELP